VLDCQRDSLEKTHSFTRVSWNIRQSSIQLVERNAGRVCRMYNADGTPHFCLLGSCRPYCTGWRVEPTPGAYAPIDCPLYDTWVMLSAGWRRILKQRSYMCVINTEWAKKSKLWCFFHIFAKYWSIFTFFTSRLCKKFATQRHAHHRHYVATLPCKI